MIPVILESPFAGDKERNIKYARKCMKDCLERGEAPFASHLLYTQEGVLNDDEPAERKKGINAGLCFARLTAKTVVYTDYGISEGMRKGIAEAARIGNRIEYRSLYAARKKNESKVIELNFCTTKKQAHAAANYRLNAMILDAKQGRFVDVTA